VIKPVLQNDAFLTDVRTAPADRLHLWWLGQSGYLIAWQGAHLLIDPYLSDSLTAKYAATDKPHVRISERVVDPSRLSFVDVVLSTHSHTDHLDGATLRAVNPRQIIAPRGSLPLVRERVGEVALLGMIAGQEYVGQYFNLAAVAAHHGEMEALGYVLRLGGHVLYHSGDTIAIEPAPLGAFGIDVAILPINGKLGNMNGCEAADLAKEIGARFVIPCHYDMFEFNTADPYEQFVPECERIGQAYRVLKPGERFTYP
jgi:L-ascorbate metabolism protein UlaG (beta-lactamase superfamily)